MRRTRNAWPKSGLFEKSMRALWLEISRNSDGPSVHLGSGCSLCRKVIKERAPEYTAETFAMA